MILLPEIQGVQDIVRVVTGDFFLSSDYEIRRDIWRLEITNYYLPETDYQPNI